MLGNGDPCWIRASTAQAFSFEMNAPLFRLVTHTSPPPPWERRHPCLLSLPMHPMPYRSLTPHYCRQAGMPALPGVSTFQSRLPVDHNIDRRLVSSFGNGVDDESPAICCYVVVKQMVWLTVKKGCSEKSLRDTFFKMGTVGACTDRHGHQLSIRSNIEQLFSIPAPARFAAP